MSVDEILSRHYYTDPDGVFWAAGYRSDYWYGVGYKQLSNTEMRSKLEQESAVVA